jgi:predicted transcriptional regulator
VTYVNRVGLMTWPTWLCDTADVDELESAAQEYRDAKAALDAVRPRLAAAIADAAKAGRRQSEIVRVTGYTRERVRQICRAAGIEPGE